MIAGARLLFALEQFGAQSHGVPPSLTAMILGSEARGLSPLWTGSDITPISVPMLGSVDSLNLSATAAILFYEALRQRKTAVPRRCERG